MALKDTPGFYEEGCPERPIEEHLEDVLKELQSIRKKVPVAFVGLSGGKDSVITCALLLKAGFIVNAFTFLCEEGTPLSKGALENRVQGPAQWLMDKMELQNGTAYGFCHIKELMNLAPVGSEEGLWYSGQREATKRFRAHLDWNPDPQVVYEYRLPMRRVQRLYEYAYLWNCNPANKNCTAAVFGTTNKTESYLGYCGKLSDMSCDFQPIISFSVSDLKKVAKLLEIPDEFVNLPPTGDTMDGLTSEQRLGFTMRQADAHERGFRIKDKEVLDKIDLQIGANLHKRRTREEGNYNGDLYLKGFFHPVGIRWDE